MTETEARHFVRQLENLCAEYERDCNCEIHLDIRDVRAAAKKTKFIIIEQISLKID